MLPSALMAKWKAQQSPKPKNSQKESPKKPKFSKTETPQKITKKVTNTARPKLKSTPKPAPEANKSINPTIKTKPTKKPKTERKSEDFDEEIKELQAKFRVNAATVKNGVKGIITLTSNNPERKNQLFGDEQLPLFLQINAIKIPKIHSKIVRVPLKHSLLTPDSEICLIVPDVKGIPNKNHEEHQDHYEKLLRKKGVSGIKKIMTFHEFRTEYETFELKSRLVELYDLFLVDGRISGKTVKKSGKIFYKKRKVPTAIKLHVTKLKEHIEQTLLKTPLYLHGKGSSFSVEIGHSKMPEQHIVENVFYLLKGLDRVFPGGFGNVGGLNLKTVKGLIFPIYTTLKNKNLVPVPEILEDEKLNEEVTGELSTRLNSKVVVKATGEVTIVPLGNNEDKDGEIDEDVFPQINGKAKGKKKSKQDDGLQENKESKVNKKTKKIVAHEKVNKEDSESSNNCSKKRKLKDAQLPLVTMGDAVSKKKMKKMINGKNADNGNQVGGIKANKVNKKGTNRAVKMKGKKQKL